MFIYLVTLLSITIYIYIRRTYSYWMRKNVPQLEPVFPLGNLNNLMDFHNSDKLNKVYKSYKHSSPLAGMYLFFQPVAVILDLQLIKTVLIKDFAAFTDRPQYCDKEKQPTTYGLFNMRDLDWKQMRHKLSPAFTSAKIKWMFPTIVEVANQLKGIHELQMVHKNVVDVRQITSRYTIDVIGSVIFGIKCNSLTNPDIEFHKQGRKTLEQPHRPKLWRHFAATYEKLANRLQLHIHSNETHQFFVNLVKNTVHIKEENNIQQKDLMNLLIELHKQKDADGNSLLTIEEIISQAFVFFSAGFDTSSNTMSFTLFELAKQSNIQDKVRAEINEVLQVHNNELTYEAISEMTYLRQCINETLRMYPPLPSLTRVAKENYLLPNTKVVLEKGTPVMIPALAIHYDEEIYPNPSKYDPERFTKENMQSRDPITFLAFGQGPRNCIGLRLGMIQSSVGLVTLLRSFKFYLSKVSPKNVDINSNAFSLTPNQELWVEVEAI